jgi:DNA primase
MAISPETIEEVNKVANVYDIISDYISLKKTGSVYVALCPFHSEKTPSFVVSPTKNIFKCFGCGISGNAIKFVMEYEKISYFDAVVKIAQKYNIPVKYLNSEKDKVYKGLYLTTRIIAEFYKESLKNSSIAKEYLKKRSISPQIVEEFEIGYSPQENDVFYRYIQEKNIQLNDLEKIGLITINENGIRDKFSGRLIFPIKDIKGNIIAFGGRTLQEGKQPKYLNSPDTVIYKKGNTLYGIYQSLPYIKEKESVIIVEGYMDCLMMHQAGFNNTVATLGTALTEEHIKLLKGLADNFYLIFDGDDAGKKAALRACEIFMNIGITPQIVLLPEGEDPDSLIRNDKMDILLESIKHSQKGIDFLIKFYKIKYSLFTTDGIRGFISDIEKHLQNITNPLEIELVYREVAKTINMTPEELINILSHSKKIDKSPSIVINNTVFSPEDYILAYLLKNNDYLNDIDETLLNEFPDTHKEIIFAIRSKSKFENLSEKAFQLYRKLYLIDMEGDGSYKAYIDNINKIKIKSIKKIK